MKTTTILLISIICASISAADFEIEIKGQPTGWNPEAMASEDLRFHRGLGQSESELELNRQSLLEQYRKLSGSGTNASGVLSILQDGQSTTYVGSLEWSHLPSGQNIEPIEGEVLATGSIEIHRVGSTPIVTVNDLLTAGTALAPLDFAILGGARDLAEVIATRHEEVLVPSGNGSPMSLYSVELSYDSNGNISGYEVTTHGVGEFVSVRLVHQNGTWIKENFHRDGDLDRVTLITESLTGSQSAYKGVEKGQLVHDNRDHEIGKVQYIWSGELPEVATLTSLPQPSTMQHSGIWLIGGIVAIAVAFWVYKSPRMTR